MNGAPGQLEQLLALSEAMLDAAVSGDWERLTSVENERSALTNGLPDNLTRDLAIADSAAARRLLEDCQRCDARVRPLVTARLNELRVVLREVRTGV